jgi:hypothetical protein
MLKLPRRWERHMFGRRTVINLHHRGNLGNRMLQYMAAMKLVRRLGAGELSSVDLREWGITRPKINQLIKRKLLISSTVTVRLDFEEIQRVYEQGNINFIDFRIFASHVDNLLPVEDYRAEFALSPDVSGYGEDVLLVNVRGSEILEAIHPEYTVVPVDFYRDLVTETGLRPVFLGQVDGDSHYLRSLRAAFPNEEFVSSRGAIADFSAIAKSKNIVSAVSTFSWLAAWLSEADRVFMPLSGFCNPFQYPTANLIPENDPRFIFYLFPENRAVPDELIAAEHAKLAGQWKRVDYEDLRPVLEKAAQDLTWRPAA